MNAQPSHDQTMTSEKDHNPAAPPLAEDPFSPLANQTHAKRPAVDDVRAVVLAVYHDPARFKPLMQATSPIPAGFTDLLSQLIGKGIFSGIEAKGDAANQASAELTSAALSYLEKVMLADPDNYYRILGLQMDASIQEIQQSYGVMRRFLTYCGQRASSGRATDLISRAYVALNDPVRRREYDRTLLRGK